MMIMVVWGGVVAVVAGLGHVVYSTDVGFNVGYCTAHQFSAIVQAKCPVPVIGTEMCVCVMICMHTVDQYSNGG